MLRKRATFDRRRGSEKTWLYSIALNLLRDNARRSRAGRGATERMAFERGTEPLSRELDQVEDRDAVGQAIGALSAEEREAVALRFGADLTVPEIAELTGNSLTTMEGRVYRALRKLRVELRAAGFLESGFRAVRNRHPRSYKGVTRRWRTSWNGESSRSIPRIWSGWPTGCGPSAPR